MTEGLVYLDFAATTPLLLEVVKVMRATETQLFANASALHTPGHLALNEIEETRELLAQILNCDTEEIIFVSSATEANNTVVQTFAGHEIITSPLEHHSLILPAKLYAKKYSAYTVPELKAKTGASPKLGTSSETEKRPKTESATTNAKTPTPQNGLNRSLSHGQMEKFKAEEPYFPLFLPPEHAKLYSYMLANNEIGEILDIKTVSKIAHAEGSFIHSDLTQCLGKIPLDVQELKLDYATVSAHKIGGPVGVAALYVKKGVPFVPLILGGNQEKKRRGGTYNTVGIIGFKAALSRLLERDTPKLYAEKIAPLRNLLAERILNEIPGSSLNTPLGWAVLPDSARPREDEKKSSQDPRRLNREGPDLISSKLPGGSSEPGQSDQAERVLPNILNVSFEAAEGESIQLYLDAEGIIVSTGSACAAGDIRPSHVLMAKTGDAEVAHSSVRFSFGLDNTAEDVERVMEVLPGIIKRLQGMSTIKMKGAR